MTTTAQSIAATSFAPARLLPWAAAGALLLGGVTSGLPGHAAADASASASTFAWAVQLDNGRSIAGISPDLPDAIQLAELGETLTPAQMAQITQVLTDEAQQQNASLTAVPVPPPPTPTPVVQSDDSGD